MTARGSSDFWGISHQYLINLSQNVPSHSTIQVTHIQHITDSIRNMSIPRQAIRSLRSLHTSARLSDAPPTAAKLGFGDYSGRTRSLPTIDIPASSRRDVGKRPPKIETKSNDQKPPRPANSKAVGGRRFPEDKTRRQSKSPLRPAQPQQTAEGDEFFTMTADSPSSSSSKSKSKPKKDGRKGMDVVDIDFNPEQLANSRTKKNTRTTNDSGSGSRKAQGEGRGQKGRSTGSEPVKREDDRSSEGIFGRASLLFPVRMGARSAEGSVWAEGMKSEDGTF